MGLLTDGDVDLILAPVPLSEAYASAADITSPFLDGGYSLLVHKGQPISYTFGFLRPFSWQVRRCLSTPADTCLVSLTPVCMVRCGVPSLLRCLQ